MSATKGVWQMITLTEKVGRGGFKMLTLVEEGGREALANADSTDKNDKKG